MRGSFIPIALILAAFAFPPAGARKKPPHPTGEILLDMDHPIIEARINGVPFRLRVGFEQKDLVELNPASTGRTGLVFEPGFDANIGKVTLPGIAATGEFDMGGRKALILVSSHGRDCCAAADGAISPTLLPYAMIRFVRQGSTAAGEKRSFQMTDDDEHGLQVAVPVGSEQVYAAFSIDRSETVASSSAGAILAKAHAGRLTGMEGSTIAAFGVSRPTRTISFTHPFRLTGFAFDQLPVRIADFAGHYDLPTPPPEPGDIVVKKRSRQQEAWPLVLIGRDRLDRCTEISFATQTRMVTLTCNFGDAAS